MNVAQRIDPEKYYRGNYALCAGCGVKPCICAKPASSPAPAPVVAFIPRPRTGNAIPFALYDRWIARFELSIYESGAYAYLCRRTHGFGRHEGDYISCGDVAAALRIGKGSAHRALDRLEALGLIEVEKRKEPDRLEYAVSFIRVLLPAE